MTTLILIFIGLVVLGLALSGKLRVMAKGLWGKLFEDMSKTPEGADAIWQQKIEKVQDNYNKMDDNYKRISGELEIAKSDREKIRKQISERDKECEALAKAQKWESVEQIVDEIELLKVEENDLSTTIDELTPVAEEALALRNKTEKALKQAKIDRKKVVADLKRNKAMENVYNDMDELKRDNSLDKLVGSTQDAVKDSEQRAKGAKLSHDNKNSTKLAKARNEAQKTQSTARMEELRKKYSTSQTK